MLQKNGKNRISYRFIALLMSLLMVFQAGAGLAENPEPADVTAVDASDPVLMTDYGMDPNRTRFFAGVLEHEGSDYTVTANIGEDAQFPEDVQMRVEEILPDNPLYKEYSAMTGEALDDDWDEVGEFARFFDITFVAVIDGAETEIEPAAYIDVQIAFKEVIPVTEEVVDIQAVHIDEQTTEIVEAETESNGAAAAGNETVDTVSFSADSFSVYGVFTRVKKTMKVITAEGDTFSIDVTYNAEAGIPAEAQLIATEITESDPNYEIYRQQAAYALKADDVSMPGLFDIGIYVNGEKFEDMKAPVNVTVNMDSGLEDNKKLYVVHFPDGIEEAAQAAGNNQDGNVTDPADGSGNEAEQGTDSNSVQSLTGTDSAEQTEANDVPEVVVRTEVAEAAVEGETVKFEAEGFSVYALAYTVDFYHGESEYKMTGGSYLSMKTLLTSLQITTEDKAQEFVNNISEATFSNPELVSVSRVGEDTTVGAIMEKLGLVCEWSAGLADEDIEGIKATGIQAVDWAIISLKPFQTEEELVLRMNNGDTYTIRVTDAQGDQIHIRVNDKDHLNLYSVGNNGYEQCDNDEYTFYKEQSGCNIFAEIAGQDNYRFAAWIDRDGNRLNSKSVSIYSRNFYGISRETLNGLESWIVIGAYAAPQNAKLIWFKDSDTRYSIVTASSGTIRVPTKSDYAPKFCYSTDNTVVTAAETTSNGQFEGWYNENGQCVTRSLSFNVNTITEDTLMTPRYVSAYKVEIDAISGPVSENDQQVWTLAGGKITSSVNWSRQYSDNQKSFYLSADDITLTAVPDTGYEFLGWYSIGTDSNVTRLSSGNTFDPRTVTADTVLRAIFVQPTEVTGTSHSGITLSAQEKSDLNQWKNELGTSLLQGTNKTAKVYDYNNRIYQIDLKGQSGLISMNADLDIAFLLDVSGSMQFPSSLVQVHDAMTLTHDHLEQAFSSSADQYHYIISDPTGTSTVYKLFKEGDIWYVVDASFEDTDSKRKVIGDTVFSFKSEDGDTPAYTIYKAANSRRRIDDLKDSLNNVQQTAAEILNNELISNNRDIRFAYNTFCYEVTNSVPDFISAKSFTFPNLATQGGTRQDLAMENACGFNWNTGAGKYAILITDGAPVASNGVSIDYIRSNVPTQAALLKAQGVTLITVGLSTKDVAYGSSLLYTISSDIDGTRQFYEAGSGDDLSAILLKILQRIVAHADIQADITDTIDPAFYPVGSDGKPLTAGTYNGYTLSNSNGNWTVTWQNQDFGWEVDNKEWTGSFLIKAKEDFLGGNAISTNSGDAVIQPTGILSANNTVTSLDTDRQTATKVELPTPYVNVKELSLTQDNTEWTVYLGTDVNPYTEIMSLLQKIEVKKVVAADGTLRYNSDGSEKESFTPDTFDLWSLISSDLDENTREYRIAKMLVAGVAPRYGYENHYRVGAVSIDLETIKPTDNSTAFATYQDDSNYSINKDGHATTDKGTPAEHYELTVRYNPTEAAGREDVSGSSFGNQDSDWWHTTEGGSPGQSTGTAQSVNKLKINVFARNLSLKKVSSADPTHFISGAEFTLYRTKRNDETTAYTDDQSTEYSVTATGTTNGNGELTFDDLHQLESGEKYLLRETGVPTGFTQLLTRPIEINLTVTDQDSPSDGLDREQTAALTATVDSADAEHAEFDADTVLLTVKNSPVTKDITVQKVWSDGTNAVSWPENISKVTVGLYKTVNNVETPVADPEDPTQNYTKDIEKPTGEENATATFAGLPQYDYGTDGATEITYSVKEESVTVNGVTEPVTVQNNRITIGTGADRQIWTASVGAGTQENEYVVTNTQVATSIYVVKRWYNAYGLHENSVTQKISVDLHKVTANGTDTVAAENVEIDPRAETPYTFTVDDPEAEYYVVEKSAFTGYVTRYATTLYENSRDENQQNDADRYLGEATASSAKVKAGGTLYVMNTATKTGMQVVMHKKWIEFLDHGMTFYLGQLDGFTTNTADDRKYMKLKVELYYDAVDVDTNTKVAEHQKVTDDEILLWEQNTSGQSFPTLNLSNNIVSGQTLYLNYIGDWEWGFRENTGSGQAGGPGNLPEYGYRNGKLVHYVYHFEETAIYDGSTHTSNGVSYSWENPEDVTDQWWKLWQNPMNGTDGTGSYTRTNIENRPKKLPVEKKWYKETNNTRVLADENDRQAVESITVKLMISFDGTSGNSGTWYEGASLTLSKTEKWKGCFNDLELIVKKVITDNQLTNAPETAKFKLEEIWNEGYTRDGANIVDHEAQLKNTLMPTGSIKLRKAWTVADSEATAVLLKLYRVSNNQVEAFGDVCTNPTKYGLTADDIYSSGNESYIKLAKNADGTWPDLTVSNLLIKRVTETEQKLDCYYFVDEAGYLTSTATTRLDIPDSWETPVYSGGENHGGSFTGRTQLLSAAPAATGEPPVLTVTNDVKYGTIQLKKIVTINGTAATSDTTAADGTFTFSIAGTAETATAGVAKEVVITLNQGVYTATVAENGGTATSMSAENGWFSVTNLPLGSYTITETGMNRDGYNLVTTFRVGETSDTGTGVSVTLGTEAQTVTVEATNAYTPGVELPSTGGSGTLMYTMAGLGMILLAGALLVSRRKRYQKE